MNDSMNVIFKNAQKLICLTQKKFLHEHFQEFFIKIMYNSCSIDNKVSS